MKRYSKAAVILGLTMPLLSCGTDTRALVTSPSAALSTLPGRLIFSGVQDQSGPSQSVVLHNVGGASLRLSGLRLGGSDPAAFELVSPPPFPQTLNPGQALTLEVRLVPRGRIGALHAVLGIQGEGLTGEVELSGLRAQGEQGDREPPLAQIVDALGYTVDVGTTNLLLGTGPELTGSEVAAPLFGRAGSGPVRLRPVARYSPDGPVPYGTFTPGNGSPQDGTPRLQLRGTLAEGHPQTLDPPVETGAAISFDPGSGPFGVYLAANSYAAQPTFTQDALNTGPTRHAVRVYPLRDRGGQPLPGSFLLAFEPGENGDYQDAVFVLENVRPLPQP